MLRFKFLFARLFSLGVILLSSVLLTASPAPVDAQTPNQVDNGNAAQAVIGTAFTYQGRLTDNGAPANGKYDFIFVLFDAETGGTQVGSNLPKEDVEVKDGFFTVQLDFGNVFDGNARYLEIGVRPGVSTGSYTPLLPRRVITPSPYALALPGVVVRNGRVGIGTSNPQTELAVRDPSTAQTVEAGAAIFVDGSNGQYGAVLGADVNNPWVGSYTNHDLRIITGNIEKVRIALNGNVGIGTTSPQAKLDVNGDIRGRLQYTGVYAWKQGEPSVQMIHSSQGFCFLTMVTGRFEGAGENVHVFIGDDGYWYLSGVSGQIDVGAFARCAGMP